MINHHPGALPEGAMPLPEAIRRFVPDELWGKFECAEADDKRASKYYAIPEMRTKSFCVALSDARRAVELAFIERLIGRDLTAIVQDDAPFGEWRPIPADAWLRFHIKDLRGRDVMGHNIELTEVHVIEGYNTQLLEPMRTGTAGRPTSKHLVLGELDRLIATGELTRLIGSGELENTLDAVARHLVSWLKQSHPAAPQMAKPTMENAIRSEFRKFKKSCG